MAISIETNIIRSRGFDIEYDFEHIALFRSSRYKNNQIIEYRSIKEINACFRTNPYCTLTYSRELLINCCLINNVFSYSTSSTTKQLLD